MTEDAASEIRTQILNRSLDEIRRHAQDQEEQADKPGHEPPQSGGAAADAHDADPCVICLEPVSEAASARPCGHRNFDLLCLLSWLEQRKRCPLCNADVRAVEYRDHERPADAPVRSIDIRKELNERSTSTDDPIVSSSSSSNQRAVRVAFSRRNRRRHPLPERRSRPPERPDAALLRRRDVYRHRLYSLHVGSNRISAYRDLVPADFTTNPSHVARARAWIRRELEAFTFLHQHSSDNQTLPPPPPPYPSSSLPPSSLTNTNTSHRAPPTPRPRQQQQQQQHKQPASNAHFLLEYIIAILKTVDVRDCSGHAENLVAEFLGRDNARLFLHELNSFLRSPYESPEAWDRHVQYPRVAAAAAATAAAAAAAAVTSPNAPPRRRRYGEALRREAEAGVDGSGGWRRKRARVEAIADDDGDDDYDGAVVMDRRMRVGRGGGGRYLDRYVPD